MGYWCVSILHNFDFAMQTYLFKTEGQAQDWLEETYNTYFAEEQRENNNNIDYDNSYCDIDYGILKWKDGWYTEFRLSYAIMGD